MNLATDSFKIAEAQAAFSQAVGSNGLDSGTLYVGTLFAPSLLFFALSGSMQLFGLHEGHPCEAYQSPA